MLSLVEQRGEYDKEPRKLYHISVKLNNIAIEI